ncbi:MAG: hypothetical protein HYY84_16665 [Deltaproteobacteria bacterium]|nr:hypothetical protein [Deltaproteobacteria bacterium]
MIFALDLEKNGLMDRPSFDFATAYISFKTDAGPLGEKTLFPASGLVDDGADGGVGPGRVDDSSRAVVVAGDTVGGRGASALTASRFRAPNLGRPVVSAGPRGVTVSEHAMTKKTPIEKNDKSGSETRRLACAIVRQAKHRLMLRSSIMIGRLVFRRREA